MMHQIIIVVVVIVVVVVVVSVLLDYLLYQRRVECKFTVPQCRHICSFFLRQLFMPKACNVAFPPRTN
jgi:hypothetical protein